MKTARRQLAAIGVVLSAVMMMAVTASGSFAAAPEPSTEASSKPVVLTIGTPEDLGTANPFKAGTVSAYEMMLLNYDMLYNFTVQDLLPTSGLAIWPPTHSEDGKTWTFKIREGVKWSDGVPLTAHDIAFTYNFINEAHMSYFAYALGHPIAKDAFEAPDDTTLIWHMEEASLVPESPPWIPILPEHIWKRFWGDRSPNHANTKEFPNVPAVGSGPFILTDYEIGQSWTMQANKEYWGGSPKIDTVVFRVFKNPEALALALKTGEIDAASGLTPALFNDLKADSNITTIEGTPVDFDDLAFNFEGTADPSLRVLEVRQAIEASIDKQTLVDRVLLGYSWVGSQVVLPQYKRYLWQPEPQEVHDFDPGRAEELLDQAGYKDRNDDGFRETPEGDPWSLEILAITDWTNSVPEAKLEAGYMEDVGIRTSVKVVDTEAANDLWYTQDFDMYQWGWDPNVDPDYILSIFTTKNCLVWSDGCYSNPTYDKLYEEQASTLDEAVRRDTIIKMQKILYDQVPEIVLLYPNVLQAYRNDRFTGFVRQPFPNGSIFFTWSSTPYLTIEPVTGSTGTASNRSGIPVALWAGIGVVVLLGAFFIWKRRDSEHTE
jgi:peptide/nickel transport system substrate-binding protein